MGTSFCESFSFVLSSPQTLNSPPQPHPLHHHHLHPQYRQLSRSQVSTQQINSPTVKMFVKSTVAVALFASFVAAQSTTSNSSIDANSSEPGLIYYQNTMPTFICEEIYKDCKEANVGVSSAQAQCDAAEKANCGHLDPANFTAAAVSATMMPAQFGTGAIALG